MSKPIELTDENLEELYQVLQYQCSSTIGLNGADHANGCSSLGELAAELDGKLTIGKIDVDSNRDSAAKQNVMSIPTLILFKDGQPIDQRIGALTKNQLQEFINEHI